MAKLVERVLFTVAGYPSREAYVDTLLGLQDSGLVDVVEVGVPFNDPIADGPIIQELYATVLADVPSVNYVLDMLQDARDQGFKLPVILMGYCNSFFDGVDMVNRCPTGRGGWDKRAKGLGIEHSIVVDAGWMRDADIDMNLIPVMSENIDQATLNQLLSLENNIIYCSSYLGVTGAVGATKSTSEESEYREKMAQLQARGNKILMGFGIKNASDINTTAAWSGCDMCVIGTAFLKALKGVVKTSPPGTPMRPAAAAVCQGMLAGVTATVKPRQAGSRVAPPPAAALGRPAPRLKICGFRTWENVVGGILEGIDLIGFVMVPASKRYFGTDLNELQRCCKTVVEAGIETVGIFDVSQGASHISDVIKAVPHMKSVQLYGAGGIGYAAAAALASSLPQDRRFIFCTSAALIQADPSVVGAVELDELFAGLCVDNSDGGTGRVWDYAEAEQAVRPGIVRKELWMAGGIGVGNAKQVAFADVVDVSSGAEDGVFDGKSKQLIGQIYRQVKTCGDGTASGVPINYGKYGGQFVSTLIQTALNELEQTYLGLCDSPDFRAEVAEAYREIAGRPTGLYKAERLSGDIGDAATIWLKREDLLHTGAHKINNALYQCLLAKYMGKKRIIAETGAGQHGVATATACARYDLPCTVYMGELDTVRQILNVQRMELMGTKVSPVTDGDRTLSSAVNEAMRDWATNIRETHYIIGSAVGPAPFPYIVRDAHGCISAEARSQFQELRDGKLPDAVVACVGGGSNAIGMFDAFVCDQGVKIYGAEPAGAAPISATEDEGGKPGGGGMDGVLHGAATYLMQDAGGRSMSTHSVSAGLDYPAVGPMHSYMASIGRVQYLPYTDSVSVRAMHDLAKAEGILCALETAHGVALAMDLAREAAVAKAKDPSHPHQDIIVCLSGRGDKDMTQASHPTRMVWVGGEASVDKVKECVDFFMHGNLEGEGKEDEMMIFEFFDRFNEELEENNKLCGMLLAEFRKQLLKHSSVTTTTTEAADIVGTGGDGKNTHNVSTPAGILAASTGAVKVLKHGNVASSSSSGSADVLGVLGANLDADPVKAMEEAGYAFVFARRAHPTMARFAKLRRNYGKRSIFNYLGPILNPFQPTINVLGVSKKELGPIYAEIVREQMPHASAMVVCSFDGVDKIIPEAATHVWTVRQGGPVEYSVRPASANGSTSSLGGGGDKHRNAELIWKALAPKADRGGGPDAVLAAGLSQFVVANAAAVVSLARQCDLAEAQAACLEAIESGKAHDQLRRYVYATNALPPFAGVLGRINSHVQACGGPNPAASSLPASGGAMQAALTGGAGPRLIAEVKLKSPTMPPTAHSPESLLQLYGASDVAAISVVTEPTFFGGSVDLVALANKLAPGKPVLRKDFVTTEAQVLETPTGPAGCNNALLLIVALLTPERLRALMRACESHGLEPVVEVVNEAELDTALSCGARIIGINNRDLNTFEVDDSRAERLAAYGKSKGSDAVFVAFSGITGRAQMDASSLGAFLVGGSILKSDSPESKLNELLAK